VIDFAAATATANEISLCLSQRFDRAEGHDMTTDVTAVAVSTAVACQSAAARTATNR
jgi:hypothetical protein